MGDQIAVMNSGAIVEQGTPTELYKHPSSEFVARFLGEMNFVPATRAQNGPKVAAKSPWGVVPLEHMSDRVTGNSMKLGFRPEDVVMGERPDALSIPAQVEHAYYIGDAILCDFRADGCAFSARLPNTAKLAEGETVTLSLLNTDLTAFPENRVA